MRASRFKPILRLIGFLLLAVLIVALPFSLWQAYYEDKLMGHYVSMGREPMARQIWWNNFKAVFAQTLFLMTALLAVLYLGVVSPVRKTTEWMRRIRMGEADPGKVPGFGRRFLQPLISEAFKITSSLSLARRAAEDEARLRLQLESQWTPDRLREFVKMKLGEKPLFVVSNREPYTHFRMPDKQIGVRVPPSGLVTAIEPVLKACGGTWIAQASGDADRETADGAGRLRVPPEEPQYTLRRVWITKEQEEGFYNGFANEGLWPLCHIAHTRPVFRSKDWEQYQAVNEMFGAVAAEEFGSAESPCVLIQDYHFALLPRLIKTRRPDARVSLFWHIPWPNPESFGILPWQKEVLQGMLGADVIGFHTQFHCNNFMDTVDRFLESRINYENFTITRGNHTTHIRALPISVAHMEGARAAEATDKTKLLKQYGIQASYLGVGVDRLDYTKGILERLRSIEQFLDSYPEYLGLFTFAQLAAPSRTAIPKYNEFVREVEADVERINARFKTKNWKPILYLKKDHSHADILPFYRAADVCLVTSLHDGMNLVAKEFVESREDEKGALILSQFTGASRELVDAILINPYDIGQTAAAIRCAIEMKPQEQVERMRRMRGVVKDRNVFRWAADLVDELARVRIAEQPALAGMRLD